jgi:hypothetical protein
MLLLQGLSADMLAEYLVHEALAADMLLLLVLQGLSAHMLATWRSTWCARSCLLTCC